MRSELKQTRDDLSAPAPAGLSDDSHPIRLYGALAAEKIACDFFRVVAAGGVLQHLALADAQRVSPAELGHQARNPTFPMYQSHR